MARWTAPGTLLQSVYIPYSFLNLGNPVKDVFLLCDKMYLCLITLSKKRYWEWGLLGCFRSVNSSSSGSTKHILHLILLTRCKTSYKNAFNIYYWKSLLQSANLVNLIKSLRQKIRHCNICTHLAKVLLWCSHASLIMLKMNGLGKII
jgi:hypothetical protein